MSTAVSPLTGPVAGTVVTDVPLDGPPALRAAGPADAAAIHGLVVEHRAEGRLLPRELHEIALHAHRFIVACCGDEVVACAELAPLSRDVAEVRSLVVGREARHLGVGGRIVELLAQRAVTAGFTRLCAFTHLPSFFVRRGFSIVPHVWLAEKILTDCHACPLFRRCGQYAVVRSLRNTGSAPAPSAVVHG
jgi:amino-acid N-acetyltransferase